MDIHQKVIIWAAQPATVKELQPVVAFPAPARGKTNLLLTHSESLAYHFRTRPKIFELHRPLFLI